MFSEEMDWASTENSFPLIRDTEKFTGVFNWNGETMLFEPDENLVARTMYEIRILGDATDIAGNKMENNFVSNFITGMDVDWNLIFEDEFNGTALDSTKWTTCYWRSRDGCTIFTNNELEWYQPDEKLVGDGTLKLRAQERTITAWDETVYDYTSGVITTGRESSDTMLPAKFLFQYGYVEIRARVSKGKGLWAAFWLLPATHESRPEIDVMEILGDESNTNHLNYHYLNAEGSCVDVSDSWAGPDFSVG